MAGMAKGAAAINPVILCGGSGSRLWPLSRANYPKQFLPLASARTLLQETAVRLAAPDLFQPPLVVCHDEHRFTVAEQLRAMNLHPRAILLEPARRNTAPAAAAAALLLEESAPGALMLVAPADHVVTAPAAFNAHIAAAAPLAAQGWLVTFGIAPAAPHTGYGYIEAGEPLGHGGHAVLRFTEKPDAARATRYLASGRHYWNSGLFLFSAARYLEELEKLRPEILEACRAALAARRADLDFLRLDALAFSSSPADSIDYAVMEHCPRVAVVPVDAGWSDVGSWEALWQIGAKDDAGNVAVGNAVAHDCRGSYLRAEHGVVAALGVSDLVIVATADAVLVAPRGRAEEVKEVLERLAAEGRPEATTHPLAHRPWGTFESIKAGTNFQVKHLHIRPGARLSLQYHAHRAEHWVVVRGTATIRRGEESFVLRPDQSTYIPTGEIHSIANEGAEELEIIEVQSGAYLGEDDIVRLDDKYGRG